MQRLKDNMIPYITEEEIDSMVSDLAKQIEFDYHGKELVLICPLKGSTLFLSDLCRKISNPQVIDFVHLTSPKGESVRILKDIGENIEGKHVLIVEEILDAGRTLSFLKTRLLASSPASLKIVALLDKPARRELPIKPDYTGKVIEDRFVVGYGLDSEELGRNYKDIYYFTQ
ncbi:MAG: hypoxanthine phosphoribosyltransferase [Bdellovibrionales bacterium]|nr:hypoxanthine phosphoribosyltransferase [Bdellovibrionales bacterium]